MLQELQLKGTGPNGYPIPDIFFNTPPDLIQFGKSDNPKCRLLPRLCPDVTGYFRHKPP